MLHSSSAARASARPAPRPQHRLAPSRHAQRAAPFSTARAAALACRAGKLISKTEVPSFIQRDDMMDQITRWACIEAAENGHRNFGLPMTVESLFKNDVLNGIKIAILREGIKLTDIVIEFDNEVCYKYDWIAIDEEMNAVPEGEGKAVAGKNIEIKWAPPPCRPAAACCAQCRATRCLRAAAAAAAAAAASAAARCWLTSWACPDAPLPPPRAASLPAGRWTTARWTRTCAPQSGACATALPSPATSTTPLARCSLRSSEHSGKAAGRRQVNRAYCAACSTGRRALGQLVLDSCVSARRLQHPFLVTHVCVWWRYFGAARTDGKFLAQLTNSLDTGLPRTC
jgi:hypothetical protein